MEATDRIDIRPAEQPVKWATGFKVAFSIAAIFWLVTHGIPWASSGIIAPTVMGRATYHPGELDFANAGLAIAMHFVCSMIYAAIMMPFIHRFPYSASWLIGAAFGCVLYLLNLAFFALVANGAPYSRELPVFVTHIAFAIIFTGAYKGLVKRRVDQVS